MHFSDLLQNWGEYQVNEKFALVTLTGPWPKMSVPFLDIGTVSVRALWKHQKPLLTYLSKSENVAGIYWKVMGVAQKIEGATENLVLGTVGLTGDLRFQIIVIKKKILWSLCFLVQDSSYRTEVRSYIHFLNKGRWASGSLLPSWLGPMSR